MKINNIVKKIEGNFMEQKRKVQKGKAKDYMRNAKYFDYYYIIFKNKRYTLKLNVWKYMDLEVKNNKVEIDNNIINLEW